MQKSRTPLKSNKTMNALRISILLGLEIKSPRSRLLSLGVFFRKIARLSGVSLTKPCSLRKTMPVLGFLLNRAAPVSRRRFFSFVLRTSSNGGYSYGPREHHFTEIEVFLTGDHGTDDYLGFSNAPQTHANSLTWEARSAICCMKASNKSKHKNWAPRC